MEEKLQRNLVREQAYLMLRDWIVEGKFKPCQKLRDKELAEQLGVSRTPIREAFIRLEEEGLIQSKPNSATIVSPIDLKDAAHLYSLVWTLEQLAMRQAFDSITKKHLKLMSEINENLLAALHANNPLKAITADNHFHQIYIELSQNDELQKILSDLKHKLKRIELYYFECVQDVSLSYDEHRHIIQTIQQKNLSATLEAIETNWRASLSRLQPNQIRSQPCMH